MELNLKNPLIFFDLETTGTDFISDRIVEISLMKVSVDGTTEVKTRRINPGIPIPPEATAIHGITNDDVKDAPGFREIARSLAAYMEGADIAGYNSDRFDIPMLAEEFLRAGVDVDLKKRRSVDVQTIYHKMEKRTLSAAYKFYCGKDLTDAHSAEADTMATYEVLKAQLDRYADELRNDVDFLSEFSARSPYADYAGRISFNENGEEVFTFGKFKGWKVADVFEQEPGYYSWMMNNSFPEYTKKVITEIRLREANKK